MDNGPASVIFDQSNNIIAVAEYAAQGGRISLRRMPAAGEAYLVQHSQVRTTTFRWSAYTTPLELATASAGDSDETITRALLAAIRSEPERLLPANTDLETTALDWSRSDPQSLTITKADIGAVDSAVQYALEWMRAAAEPLAGRIHENELPWTVAVETPSRALVRFWLNHVADRNGDRYTSARDAVVAFVTVDSDGYAIALWSALTGLVHETEERLRAENDIGHITDLVCSLVNPASLLEFNMRGRLTALVICSASPQPLLCQRLEGRLAGVEIMRVDDMTFGEEPVNYAAALAIGSLLDDPRIPRIDLADSLPTRLSRIEGEREWRRVAEVSGRVRQAAVYALVPIVIMLGIALAWYVSTRREETNIQAATRAATEEAARLANEARLRKSYEDQTRYYMALTDQILQLRERQPFMLKLLTDLNERWPRDSTLSIMSLRTTAAGGVELKGKTRQQDTVTQLASSLEFGGGRFVDISPESKADIPGLTQGAAPTPAGMSSPIITFTIKATYTPLAAALSVPKPPPPPTAPPGGPTK